MVDEASFQLATNLVCELLITRYSFSFSANQKHESSRTFVR